jgi:hypothetical protein
VAAASSSIGQFQAEMASDSYQLQVNQSCMGSQCHYHKAFSILGPDRGSLHQPSQGMAERGFIPKVFGLRSKHDTPTLGIVLSSVGVLGLTMLDFISIVELLNGNGRTEGAE